MRMGRNRRWLLTVFMIGSGVAVQAAAGWGCASLASVDATPNVVRPGQEVAWRGTFFIRDEPVTLRWNTLDGPVLSVATPPGPDNGLHGNWRFVDGTFTVPSDARPGTYLLIATQNAVKGSQTWGVPARGLIQVSDGSPILGQQPGPPPVERPTDLLTSESLSGGDFVLAAAGAAGVALLLAGIGVVLAAGRRAGAPRPQPSRSPQGA